MIDSIVVLASILALVFLLQVTENRSESAGESDKHPEKT
jgi:hypothetical protein